jgi:hypothetical protein
MGAAVHEVLRALKWAEPAVDLVRLALFAVFVALGLIAARGGDRRRTDALLAYLVAVTTAVGVVQLESWPFTNWALVSHPPSRHMSSLLVEAEDGGGRTAVVDLRVLQPVPPEDFAVWLKARGSGLDPAGRERLGRFLLARAEDGRRDLVAGGRVAPNQRLLGALAAPYHFHDAKTWTSAAQVPDRPFTRVRASFLEWDPEERYRDETRVTRRVVLEYPPR